MTFLATAAEVFEVPALGELRKRLMQAGSPGHFAVVFGGVMRLLGIDLKTAVKMFLFVCVAGCCRRACGWGCWGLTKAASAGETGWGPGPCGIACGNDDAGRCLPDGAAS